ncbi:MAG: hypothetical protein BGO31_00260 [Bacteroidetes bacterium 43-16]|uniref:hypothetical protein n=1 Tax=uncultured Dysgonomonas sp. TaxID=206096 RepID=UPI000929B783|nr:hypothetical protein [uncultured Dysgonomonas sp.]OJV51672.1 MAG: hypothetical protein BGO31_00260 [Bacteroidetes bacterium 43-16]
MRRGRSYYEELYLSKEECRAIAKNAKNNSCWVNYKKEWFTPDEFVQAANSQDIYMHPGYTRFETKAAKIKDPRDMIPRLDARLQELKDIRDQFANKVEDYYMNTNKLKNRS